MLVHRTGNDLRPVGIEIETKEGVEPPAPIMVGEHTHSFEECLNRAGFNVHVVGEQTRSPAQAQGPGLERLDDQHPDKRPSCRPSRPEQRVEGVREGKDGEAAAAEGGVPGVDHGQDDEREASLVGPWAVFAAVGLLRGSPSEVTAERSLVR